MFIKMVVALFEFDSLSLFFAQRLEHFHKCFLPNKEFCWFLEVWAHPTSPNIKTWWNFPSFPEFPSKCTRRTKRQSSTSSSPHLSVLTFPLSLICSDRSYSLNSQFMNGPHFCIVIGNSWAVLFFVYKDKRIGRFHCFQKTFHVSVSASCLT